MNANHRSTFHVISLLLLSLMTLFGADEFTVDSHQFGLGGGASSSEEFTVIGSFGQPVVGESLSMVADEFAVTGGFGLVIVLTTEDAPALAVTVTAQGSVTIQWPASAAGWELRQSTNLSAGIWESTPESVQVEGTRRFIRIERPAGIRLFRLSPAPR